MRKKTIMVGLSTILVFVLCSSSHAWPIPDTGQTKCYDNTEEIPCPQPGEPFYGQDGNYTINPPSYTKLDANGNDLPDDATEWVMVRDNVTGLIWEMKNNMDGIQDYSNPHDADNTYTWYDSNPLTNGGYAGTPGDGTDTEDFINALNSARVGGFSDWRPPTIKELRSIVDYGRLGPSINTTYFSNIVASSYWTSTTRAGGTSFAFLMDFLNGLGSYSYKSIRHYAPAVRGGKAGNQFINNGDGTITDSSTGLMWQQVTATGTYTWEQALSYCENLMLAGYTDWRLPTMKELDSIVDLTSYNLGINTSYFPDTVASYCWSSTGYTLDTNKAWYMVFENDFDFYSDKSIYRYVRSMRGGQFRVLSCNFYA